ncbi:hypothetical protein SAMN05443244_0799 [Terriglobus roseus]|uniref:Uncharacterized protein n=1 Tax=Terriglobus roseus TaxID=392734 RepID=A0A1H4JU46_9BACT|nr:hypothetical protein SAMN05443244_0799 [Terriglobus roseus]
MRFTGQSADTKSTRVVLTQSFLRPDKVEPRGLIPVDIGQRNA